MSGGFLLRARDRGGIGVAETGEALDGGAYPTARSPGEAGGRPHAGHGRNPDGLLACVYV